MLDNTDIVGRPGVGRAGRPRTLHLEVVANDKDLWMRIERREAQTGGRRGIRAFCRIAVRRGVEAGDSGGEARTADGDARADMAGGYAVDEGKGNGDLWAGGASKRRETARKKQQDGCQQTTQCQ